MSGQRYTTEFKEEAVKLITERGYSVTDVSKQLGVSQHSIYKWLNAVQPSTNHQLSIKKSLSLSKQRKRSFGSKANLDEPKKNAIF